MALDQQLRHSFDTLATRLRVELAGHVEGAIADLSELVEADRARAVADATREARTGAEADRARAVADAVRDTLTAAEADRARAVADAVHDALTIAEADRARAVAAAVQGARAAAEREASERLTLSLAAADLRTRAIAETGEMDASERLVNAVRVIDRGRSLSEILDALVLSAGAEAARAAVFLPEGSRLRGWRLVGFETEDQDATHLELAFDAAGILGDAANTGEVVRAGEPASGSSRSVPPAFAELAPERPAVAVPLVMSGQVFAVLYADQGLSGEILRHTWPAAMEVLARHAARSLEAVTAFRLAQLSEMRTW